MFGALGSTSGYNFVYEHAEWGVDMKMIKPNFFINTFELKIVSHMFVWGSHTLAMFYAHVYVMGVATRTY